MKNIAIIGAGAAGLSAANYLNQNSSLLIDIYEKNKIGRKILASGNGRCNISNTNIFVKDSYNNDDFASKINLSREEFDKFLFSLKLTLSKEDEDGRLFPYSYHSLSAYNAFVNHLNKNVKFIFKEVNKIDKLNNKYLIDGKTYDYVLISIGSSANEKKDLNLDFIKRLGHNFSPLNPSIHYLYVKENLKEIENIRVKVSISLVLNNTKYTRKGEILFKKDHISGICVFELSSILARAKAKNIDVSDAYFIIDLLPDKDTYNECDIESYFHPSLFKFLSKKSGDFKDCKNYKLHLLDKEVNNFDAQVMSGGVKLNEFNDNLESLFNPNLYFMGEVLDIDGNCGGYNLHFAISSGVKVAKDIFKKEGL